MDEMEMVRRVKLMVDRLVAGRVDELPFCSAITGWQINKFYAKKAEKKLVHKKLKQHFWGEDAVEHGKYAVQVIDKISCMVYGNFRVIGRNHRSGVYGYPYEISVIMKNGMAERIILHGDRDEPVFCVVKSDEDHLYMLRESEILYIESNHNYLIWHCRDMEVRGRGTLKSLEEGLPRHFFRMQRGYIVNVNHIKSLKERELVIDNGDILPSPARTYNEVKRQIAALCPQRMMQSPS